MKPKQLGAIAISTPTPTLPIICSGTNFELVLDTAIGSMRPYLRIWLGNGQVAFNQSACLAIQFTIVSSGLHMQCARCYQLKCFVIADSRPACLQCMKCFKDQKICEDIAAHTYLVMKGKVLDAAAS